MGNRTTQTFEWPTEEDDFELSSHAYPPDAYFNRYLSFTFTRLFILLAVIATGASIIRVGFPETGIPYNYPVFAGLLYIIAALIVLRRFHSIFDETKHELVRIFDRTSVDDAIFTHEEDVTPEIMVDEIEEIMNKAFHPFVILVGGFIGGIFSLIVMWALDVFSAYPYLLLNYAYGAGHGFYYGPIIGSVYLIYKISNVYIVDIDILDPDGVGGYRKIGDAIVSLIIFGIFLVTFDFIILSSVSFLNQPLFQTAVFGLYALMLLFLLGLTIFGVLSIRRRLLSIREAKTDMMRNEFKTIEATYWEKLKHKDSPQPEADHIQTMNTMFNQLYTMELWPINLASFARLSASTGSSVAVAAYKAGYIPIPI